MTATLTVPPARGSSQAHPHLFFRAADRDALRQKMTHPLFDRDWKAIEKRAQAALEETADAPKATGDQVLKLAYDAAACAFAWHLAGEEKYKRRAQELTSRALGMNEWTGDYLNQPGGAQFHLRSAMICQSIAVAYDILAPEMTAEQRKHFADVCWEKALRVYIGECKESNNTYLTGNRTMNWLAVLSSGAGCLFIALDGDACDFSREIEIARAHLLRFIEWYDDDGSALERGSYWAYGMGHALHFLRALEQNGWPMIMHQASKKLDRCGYPIMYACVGGKNVINVCDDHYGPMSPGRDSALMLAAAFNDPSLQWWAHQMPAGDILGLVVAKPQLAAVAPDHLPTCMVFQRTGIGILRDSMSSPDTRILGIKAGRTRGEIYDDPHCQFDLNAVVLEAFGQPLLADPGYGHSWTGPYSTNDPNHPTNATPPHNTLLVDGGGQEAQWSPLATLVDLSPSREVDCIVSRIEQGYGPKVARFDRHVYMIDKRFYVLLDDVETTTPAALTFNFHGAKDAKLATSPATIVNQDARLEIVSKASTPVTVASKTDHVLPRLEWSTNGKVQAGRFAWLLMVTRVGETAAVPTLQLHEDSIVVTDGGKQHRLPIVTRRRPDKFSMTLIPPIPKITK